MADRMTIALCMQALAALRMQDEDGAKRLMHHIRRRVVSVEKEPEGFDDACDDHPHDRHAADHLCLEIG